jgi:hypothetical protein
MSSTIATVSMGVPFESFHLMRTRAAMILLGSARTYAIGVLSAEMTISSGNFTGLLLPVPDQPQLRGISAWLAWMVSTMPTQRKKIATRRMAPMTVKTRHSPAFMIAQLSLIY